jgi:fatty acid desaturase
VFPAQTYAEPRLSEREGQALWRALHDRVAEHGLAAPSPGRTFARLVLLLLLLAAALAAAWFAASWTWRLLAWASLALLLAQFAFIGHDAGHGSIARAPALNRALGQLAMTLVTGLAFDEWIQRHRAHHRFCQDGERDPDMDVSLIASLTEDSLRGKGPFGRFMTRHQAAHVWLLSFLFGHSQRHLSQAAVLAAPRRQVLDLATLAAHFALWFGLPCGLLDVSWEGAFAAYFVPLTLLGPYLAAIFWTNHVGMPLVRDVGSFSFLEHQALTSRTILNPRRWDWLFGGLNFQIEHHLFPQVPSFRLARLQPIVHGHLVQARIPYNGSTWLQAARMIAAHFARVGRSA